MSEKPKINSVFLATFSIVLASVLLSGCGEKEKAVRSDANQGAAKNSTGPNWARLSGRSVFFQHESVGKNILDGIADVTRSGTPLQVSIKSGSDENAPGGLALIDRTTGKNGDPVAKIDKFRQAFDEGAGTKPNLALMKMCYVDVTPGTDLNKVFNHYKTTMQYLKGRYPNVTFVHLTVPIQRKNHNWRTAIKEALGKSDIWEYDENAARGRYNELVRREYAGKEPLFDIAAIESTRQNGEKEGFSYRGTRYEAMLDEYTTDGGHLNEQGRRVVAGKLLDFLASL
jgi:hypothetical protein